MAFSVRIVAARAQWGALLRGPLLRVVPVRCEAVVAVTAGAESTVHTGTNKHLRFWVLQQTLRNKLRQHGCERPAKQNCVVCEPTAREV